MSQLSEQTTMPIASIFQIFYDAKSYENLDKGFIALDNSNSMHPELYEFWPILQFLRSNTLIEGHWYGFLSPRFRQKTGLSSAQLHAVLAKIPSKYQVVLPTHSTDKIIWFDNIFYQGEFWHPGLMQAAQAFVNYAELDIEIKSLVSHSQNSAFSNFVVAKLEYWQRWKLLAERLLSFSGDKRNSDSLVNTLITHRAQKIPMSVFLQERLIALALLNKSIPSIALPLSYSLRQYDARMQEHLITMDVLKRQLELRPSHQMSSVLKTLKDQLVYDKTIDSIAWRRQ